MDATRRRRPKVLGYNTACRNRCRSRTMVERTDRYEVWLCTTCDDRRVLAIQQIALFEVDIPEQPDADGAPDGCV